jgi:glutamate/aspartate transport system substrate-binding protein
MRQSLCFLVLAAALHFASPGAHAATPGGTLDKVRATGTLVIGYRETSVPFSYLDGDGKPIGYALEICRRIADAVKQELNMPGLKVEYQPLNPSNRIPLLQNGTVDLGCGQDTNTVERQKQVAFSTSIFMDRVAAAARKDSGLERFEQLHGRSVAVNPGATGVELIDKYERDHHAGITKIYGKDTAETFLLMSTGRAAATVGDDIVIAGLIANSRHPGDYRFLTGTLRAEPFAIMLRKDDADFKRIADATIKGLYSSGQIEKLYATWFTQPIPPHGINMNFPQTPEIRALFVNPNDRGV